MFFDRSSGGWCKWRKNMCDYQITQNGVHFCLPSEKNTKSIDVLVFRRDNALMFQKRLGGGRKRGREAFWTAKISNITSAITCRYKSHRQIKFRRDSLVSINFGYIPDRRDGAVTRTCVSLCTCGCAFHAFTHIRWCFILPVDSVHHPLAHHSYTSFLQLTLERWDTCHYPINHYLSLIAIFFRSFIPFCRLFPQKFPAALISDLFLLLFLIFFVALSSGSAARHKVLRFVQDASNLRLNSQFCLSKRKQVGRFSLLDSQTREKWGKEWVISAQLLSLSKRILIREI